MAAPCPTSSRSRSADRPRSLSLSTATADSRLSTLAITVIVNTANATAPHRPSGSSGSRTESSSEPGSSTLSTSHDSTPASNVAPTTPTSEAGTPRTAAGITGHSSSTPSTTSPTTASPVCTPSNCAGSCVRFSHAPVPGSPPSSTCSCANAIVTPIPASIPCTTAGEMASAARATRLTPSPTCNTPAATVMAHVTAHPNCATNPATTNVNPAAGPLTCNGAPPSNPATTPPTTAAINPAVIGASEATAMPNDNGIATRNTTNDADRSYLRSRLAHRRTAARRVCWTVEGTSRGSTWGPPGEQRSVPAQHWAVGRSQPHPREAERPKCPFGSHPTCSCDCSQFRKLRFQAGKDGDGTHRDAPQLGRNMRNSQHGRGCLQPRRPAPRRTPGRRRARRGRTRCLWPSSPLQPSVRTAEITVDHHPMSTTVNINPKEF